MFELIKGEVLDLTSPSKKQKLKLKLIKLYSQGKLGTFEWLAAKAEYRAAKQEEQARSTSGRYSKQGGVFL